MRILFLFLSVVLAAVPALANLCDSDWLETASGSAVRSLLRSGADVNEMCNVHRNRPLHQAILTAGVDPEVIEVLVNAGGDILAENIDGSSVLDYAERRFRLAERNFSPGSSAYRREERILSGINRLLESDAASATSDQAVNCEAWNTDEFFETATASVVRACLAAGADVAAHGNSGKTPLHWAASISDPDSAVMEALLAAGAPLEARDMYGSTPLHYATNLAAVEVLLAAGADVAARSEDEESPLHMAAWLMRPDVVAALIAAGADIEARMADGKTPLHAAASTSGYYEPPLPEYTIQALLDAGANPTARDADGKTPWDLIQGNEALVGSNAYLRLRAAYRAEGAESERLANERLQRARRERAASEAALGGGVFRGAAWCQEGRRQIEEYERALVQNGAIVDSLVVERGPSVVQRGRTIVITLANPAARQAVDAATGFLLDARSGESVEYVEGLVNTELTAEVNRLLTVESGRGSMLNPVELNAGLMALSFAGNLRTYWAGCGEY